MFVDVIKDTNGKTSAKRVAGFFALGVFAALSFILVIRNPEIVGPTLAITWGSLIAALFGVSIAEKKNVK